MAIDKLILFIISLALYLPGRDSFYVVVPIILIITLGAISSWLEMAIYRLAILVLFAALCLYDPSLTWFLPLMCFDLLAGRMQSAVLIAVLPPAIHYQELGAATIVQLVLLVGLAWFLKSRALHLDKARRQALDMRDSAREISLQLENKNKELLEKQDYEINLATLNERNRIAREIHDHVGHLLTRAILQLGALLTTVPQPEVHDPIQAVKDTLSESMDEIRHSLHDLHESSLDLQNELQKMISEFSFCPVKLKYSLEVNPEPKFTYTFLAVTREALANVVRHSRADLATITLREHPGLYQLIIQDNGQGKKQGAATGAGIDEEAEKGIGLRSMEERIRKLDGQINFKSEKGWTIFITVPRKESAAGGRKQL